MPSGTSRCVCVCVCVSVVLVGAEWVFRFSFWFITMASCCILDSQDTAITGNDQFVNDSVNEKVVEVLDLVIWFIGLLSFSLSRVAVVVVGLCLVRTMTNSILWKTLATTRIERSDTDDGGDQHSNHCTDTHVNDATSTRVKANVKANSYANIFFSRNQQRCVAIRVLRNHSRYHL